MRFYSSFIIILLFLNILIFSEANNFSITVSSSLEENINGNIVEYSENNLIDGDRDTCWVEGSEGAGIGESITITFSDSRFVNQILLYNGFQKSIDLFYKNNRVNEIDVILNDDEIRTYYLYDTNLASVLWIQSVASKIEIIIKDTYSGWKYDDTCISELVILDEYPPGIKVYDEEGTDNLIKLRYLYYKKILGQLDKSEIAFLMDEYEKQEVYDRENSINFNFQESRLFLLNEGAIDSKYLFTRMVTFLPQIAYTGSELLLNKKSLFIEIADQIQLNELLKHEWTEHGVGEFILDSLFSEEDEILFESLHGYSPPKIHNRWWLAYNEKYFSKNLRKSSSIFELKELEINTDREIAWTSDYDSAYWESIRLINPNNRSGSISILINETFSINHDFSESEIIYIGCNISRTKINIEFDDNAPGSIILDPLWGHNFFDFEN